MKTFTLGTATASFLNVSSFKEHGNYRKQMDYYLDNMSRKAQDKYVYRRTIEMLQRTHICKVNCGLKVYNAHLKLA